MTNNQYLKLSTMEYPVEKQTIENILLDVHDQLEREVIIADHVFVKETHKPTPGEYQVAVLDIPKESSTKGEWFQTWKLVSIFKDFTDSEGRVFTAKDQELKARAEKEARRLNGIENLIVREIQKRLDTFVKLKQYDSVDKVYMRATLFGSPFQEECFNAAILMDKYWETYVNILTQVKLGHRKHPESFAQIEKDLPILDWNWKAPRDTVSLD